MKNLNDLLALCQEADTSVLLEGVHGIGKSERVENYAKDNDLHCEVLFLSHQETGDLIGIPYLDGKNTDWSVPVWLQKMNDAAKRNKKCVLFLDELNRARLDVRQSALQLVLCKQIHQHHLPPGTLVVAAVNPDDEYQVQELDPALKDRFVVFKLKPDAEAWIDWARNNDIHDSVISFIAENPDRIWVPIKNENESNQPTPRGWKKTSDFLKALEKKNLSETLMQELLLNYLNGKIGASVGQQFFYFWKTSSGLSAKKIDSMLKKVKNRTKANIEEGVDILTPILEKTETIKLQIIFDDLVKKYNQKKGQSAEDFMRAAYPLYCFLHALNLEVLHSILKGLKQKQNSDADSKSAYDKILELDSYSEGKIPLKSLFVKIIEKMK